MRVNMQNSRTNRAAIFVYTGSPLERKNPFRRISNNPLHSPLTPVAWLSMFSLPKHFCTSWCSINSR